MKFYRVTKKRPCSLCDSTGWCGVADDGTIAVCMRVKTDRQAKNGGWIHQLIEPDRTATGKPKTAFPPVVKLTPPAVAVAKKRAAGDLDRIYRAFLDRLVLSFDHSRSLEDRGVTKTDAALHGYKSMPSPVWANAILRELAERFDLRHVPGFFRRGSTWHFIDYRKATGFLVPIRNARHEIVALQLRRDDDQKPKYLMVSSAYNPDGASCGTPAHFSYLGILGAPSSFKEVVVTEGALKANIIASYSETPTVGLVGVGCFDDMLPAQLKAAFPSLEKVMIAFDMDASTNEAVKCQRDRLVMTLQKINFKTRILSWNAQFKGFDDFLVASKTKIKLAA